METGVPSFIDSHYIPFGGPRDQAHDIGTGRWFTAAIETGWYSALNLGRWWVPFFRHGTRNSRALKSNPVHLIQIDGSYDMVAEQEILKYGRPSGAEFGPVDPVKYAEAFGAKGLMIQSPDQIPSVLKQAFDTPGPVLVGVQVDDRDNRKLFEEVDDRSIH